MVFQIKIHLEEGVGIKNKLKIVLISLIFCIVTLSFYKIIINEIFTSDSIFLKAAKSILIILASLIVTVILYGLYLERMFERKYRGSVKVYLDKSRWREATIIILYSFVILYSFGMVFNIWTFILLPYISMLVFGLKNNGIIVELGTALAGGVVGCLAGTVKGVQSGMAIGAIGGACTGAVNE